MDSLSKSVQSVTPSILIGTSGYEYPSWNTFFYPFKSGHLTFYAKHFNCVEVNSTFYGTPLTKTIKKWIGEVDHNPNFRFIIKVSKFITHSKKLNNFEECWDKFWNGKDTRGGIQHIHHAGKLSCLLFQFPPNFKCTKKNLTKFQIVKETIPKDVVCAFEFRDSSWYDGKQDLFTKNWILVFPILDNTKFEAGWAGNLENTPLDPLQLPEGDSIYLRFHGTKGQYVGSYDSDCFLEKLCSLICSQKRKNVWLIFNNTDSTFCHQIPMVINGQYLLMKTNELNENADKDRVCCLHDGLHLMKILKLFQ